MKIIFLDIDGVLNSRKCSEEKHFKGSVQICPELIQNLNRIIRETGAGIVVTSTWRLAGLAKIRRRLKIVGVEGKIIGITPDTYFSRGMEISFWECECPKKYISDNYVILDDYDDFFDYQKQYLVRTDSSVGLSEKNADRAIEILGRK